MKIKSSIDLIISFGLFLILVLLQSYFILFIEDFQYYFASEYGNIAESLIKGKGFGNPFNADTGPTAWTAPLLVWIIALGLLAAGKTMVTFFLLSVVKFVSLSIVLYLIFKIFELLRISKNYIIILSLFLLFLALNFNYLFFDLNDFWLSNLIISVFLYSLLKYKKHKHKKSIIGLYISAIFIPLINPAYTTGIFVIVFFYLFLPDIKTIFGYLLKRRDKKITLKLIHSHGLLLVLMISLSFWSARNYAVFNQFIPVKSNLWFEFHLANIVDEDGVVSRSSMYEAHPFLNQSVRNELARKGEKKWLQIYERQSYDYLNKNLTDYARKVANRLFNAFIFTENILDLVQSEYLDRINDADRQKLLDNYFINDDRWNQFHLDKERFENELKNLDVRDQDSIINDWTKAKDRYLKFKYSISNIFRGILISLIPTLSILFILINRRPEIKKGLHYIIILYLVYLLPYIIISHQIRYQRELFALQILLISITLSLSYARTINSYKSYE